MCRRHTRMYECKTISPSTLSPHPAVIKIELVAYQILTSIPDTFATMYPAAFAKFLNLMSFVSAPIKVKLNSY